MKKISFALSSIVIASASNALASEVRVTGLGRSQGVDDQSAVFTYPSLVTTSAFGEAQIGDPVFGEASLLAVGQSGSHGFGLALGRKPGVFTHYNNVGLTTDTNELSRFYIERYSLAKKMYQAINVHPERPVDGFYGIKLDDSGLGVRLFAASSLQSADGTRHDSATSSQFDVHLGGHFPMLSGRMDAALMFGGIGKIAVKNQTEARTDNELNVDRNKEFRVQARYIDLSKDGFAPYYKMGFDTYNPKIKRTNGTASENQTGKELSFDFGAGVNTMPEATTLITAGFSGLYSQSEGPYSLKSPSANVTLASALAQGTEQVALDFSKKTKRRTMALLSTMGLEKGLSERWGLLGGFEYVLWGNTKVDYPLESSKFESLVSATTDANVWQFGGFYKIEKFRLDAVMSLEDILHNGPFILTGSQTQRIVGQVAATYQF